MIHRLLAILLAPSQLDLELNTIQKFAEMNSIHLDSKDRSEENMGSSVFILLLIAKVRDSHWREEDQNGSVSLSWDRALTVWLIMKSFPLFIKPTLTSHQSSPKMRHLWDLLWRLQFMLYWVEWTFPLFALLGALPDLSELNAKEFSLCETFSEIRLLLWQCQNPPPT